MLRVRVPNVVGVVGVVGVAGVAGAFAALAVSVGLTLASGLAVAGCRDDLCVRTLYAVCPCDDPLQPTLDQCIAQYDVVSCAPVDAAVVDPCQLAPCCRGPRDAARPFDLGPSSSDGL